MERQCLSCSNKEDYQAKFRQMDRKCLSCNNKEEYQAKYIGSFSSFSSFSEEDDKENQQKTHSQNYFSPLIKRQSNRSEIMPSKYKRKNIRVKIHNQISVRAEEKRILEEIDFKKKQQARLWQKYQQEYQKFWEVTKKIEKAIQVSDFDLMYHFEKDLQSIASTKKSMSKRMEQLHYRVKELQKQLQTLRSIRR